MRFQAVARLQLLLKKLERVPGAGLFMRLPLVAFFRSPGMMSTERPCSHFYAEASEIVANTERRQAGRHNDRLRHRPESRCAIVVDCDFTNAPLLDLLTSAEPPLNGNRTVKERDSSGFTDLQ